MATLQELIVKIGADIDGLDKISRGFKEAESTVDDFLGSIGTIAATGGKILSALGLDEIPDMAMEAAKSISGAEASLTGMYGSAEQAGEMLSFINKEFGGTRVGAAAMNDMAVSFGYMGIEGEKAEKIMRNVADAVEFAGGSSTHVESVSGALINAQNAGTVFNDTLNQISGNGVPIFEALGEQLGVTSGEIKEMASNGEISFEELMETMENLSGPSMDKVREGVGEVRATWDYQWDAMKSSTALALGEMLNEVLKTEEMGAIMGGAMAAVEGFPDLVRSLGTALVDAGVADAIMDIARNLYEFGVDIAPIATGFFMGFVAAISGGMQVFLFLSEMLSGLGSALGGMEGALTVVGALLGGLIGTALMVALAVKTVSGAIALWRVVMTAWRTVMLLAAAAKLLFNAALWASPITWVVLAIVALIAVIALLIYYWDDIAAVASAAWDWIAEKSEQATAVVAAVFDWLLGILAGWALDLILIMFGAWQAVEGVVQAGIDWVVALVLAMVSGVISFFAMLAALPGMIGGYFQGLYQRAKQQGQNLLSFVRGIPGAITSGLGNLGSLLTSAGKNVIQGLINGIRSMIGRVGSEMSNIASTIRSYLPFSPAKVGPLSGGGAPEVSGARIAETLGEGIMSELAAIDQAADALMAPLDARVSGMRDMTRHIPTNVNTAVRHTGSRSDTLLLDVTGADEEFKKVLRKIIRNSGGNVQQVLGQGR